jgi:hypothetical protein
LGTALAVAAISVASGEQLRRINVCFEETLAPLRLSQLEQGIGHCDRVIGNRATVEQRRGEAYAQRGLMRARQWSILNVTEYAVQGISDITEGLRLHTPAMERKHQLLLMRAQLYIATGQIRQAGNDYTTILNEDPANIEAKSGRSRIGALEGS